MPKTRLQIVADIPVNQKAKATGEIKRYLLEKLRAIHQNRTTIEHSRHQAEREKVLSAYRKAVGFDKLIDRYLKAKKEKRETQELLLRLGLTEEGTLLELADLNNYRERGPFVWDHRSNHYTRITDAEAAKIREVHNLLNAVHAEMNVYSTFDQLETRMMLADTVGECQAIVNAVADRDIFEVNPEVLMLENGKEEKKKRGSRNR